MQNLFLDVRGQIQQVHDLRDPCAADMPEPGEVGIIADFAPVHHLLELDGQGHQAGEPGNGGSIVR